MTCVRFSCVWTLNTAGWAISVLCRGHSALFHSIVRLQSLHKIRLVCLASRELEHWAKRHVCKLSHGHYSSHNISANERLIFVQGSQQNSTNGPGAPLMPSGAHYPVRHRHVIAKLHSCPELSLIPFTKPCPASWSSDHEQFCRVDFLIYPSNLGSDLCKIRCCAGAAEWAAEWGLPYGVLWRYVS